MNLTCYNNVQQWLNLPAGTDTALINRLITSLSNSVMNYLQRPNFAQATYNETLSGVGSTGVMLRNWPVLSVSSVTVSTVTVPVAASSLAYGYSFNPWDGSIPGVPQTLLINGVTGSGPQQGYNGWNTAYGAVPGIAGFNKGLNNVNVVYVAGYSIINEAQNVPLSASYILTPNCPGGPWSQDNGVSYANGTALVKVSGAPAQGQYSVAVVAASGIATYTFNAADAGASVLLNYSFTPADLEQAVIEWIAERYSYKGRIGMKSQSLGGQESISYQLGMPDFIARSLNPYRKAFPL